jgi:hypothetical protein
VAGALENRGSSSRASGHAGRINSRFVWLLPAVVAVLGAEWAGGQWWAMPHGPPGIYGSPGNGDSVSYGACKRIARPNPTLTANLNRNYIIHKINCFQETLRGKALVLTPFGSNG